MVSVKASVALADKVLGFGANPTPISISEEVYLWGIQEEAHDPFHIHSRIPLISFFHESSQQGFFSGSQASCLLLQSVSEYLQDLI